MPTENEHDSVDDPSQHEQPVEKSSATSTSHQVELFETEPPPWELAVQDDVAFATVVFSEAPHGPYDYRIPDSMRNDLKPGMRVRVPLGKRRKPITGWCIETKFGSRGKAITSRH